MKKIVKDIDNGEYIEVIVAPTGVRSHKDFLRKRKKQDFYEVDLPEGRFFRKDKDGNIIEDAFKELLLSTFEKQKKYKKRIEQKLNEIGKTLLNLDNYHNVGVYTGDENGEYASALTPLANKFAKFCGDTWAKAKEIEASIKNQETAMPATWEELDAMLPVWEG